MHVVSAVAGGCVVPGLRAESIYVRREKSKSKDEGKWGSKSTHTGIVELPDRCWHVLRTVPLSPHQDLHAMLPPQWRCGARPFPTFERSLTN